MNQIKIIILLISLVLASSVILFLCLNPLCTEVEVFCPDPSYKFKTQTCCSVVWWSLGAGLGVGNECVINMDEMRSNCPMYDCYFKQTGEWNSNGCSYVPEMLLNENSCDIHDLCYITPGATKDSCDTSFVENIGRIYCNNVHFVEYLACRSRASIAGSVVQGFSSFWDESEGTRKSCNIINSWFSFKYLLLSSILAVFSVLFCRNQSRKNKIF
ncbi:uncharacterized protein LOC111716294 isoform X1 [Eurytemora carolleeae]|uniref:uncharacterized protein LOC111716294 isoform X1 n=1 Tax=Eurytemora carolleeae TaxID=1294199 RepID=UPI000C7779BC|nr:uncharacterized protein LOC111716294 isoform X1 [Eurytemora carolleeae]|eukprot:XP_023347504.1 uncharacterized protein LOC111716294 isoform X1 [Eurytemora affinis]